MADTCRTPPPHRHTQPAAPQVPPPTRDGPPGSPRLRFLTMAAGPSGHRPGHPSMATPLMPNWRRPGLSVAALAPVIACTEVSAGTGAE
jgi:hypothetical protein